MKNKKIIYGLGSLSFLTASLSISCGVISESNDNKDPNIWNIDSLSLVLKNTKSLSKLPTEAFDNIEKTKNIANMFNISNNKSKELDVQVFLESTNDQLGQVTLLIKVGKESKKYTLYNFLTLDKNKQQLSKVLTQAKTLLETGTWTNNIESIQQKTVGEVFNKSLTQSEIKELINNSNFNKLDKNVQVVYSFKIDDNDAIINLNLSMHGTDKQENITYRIQGFKLSDEKIKTDLNNYLNEIHVSIKDSEKSKLPSNIFNENTTDLQFKEKLNITLPESDIFNTTNTTLGFSLININDNDGSITLSLLLNHDNVSVSKNIVINNLDHNTSVKQLEAKFKQYSEQLDNATITLVGIDKQNTYVKNVFKPNANSSDILQKISFSENLEIPNQIEQKYSFSTENNTLSITLTIQDQRINKSKTKTWSFEGFKHLSTLEDLEAAATNNYQLIKNQAGIDRFKLQLYSASIDQNNYSTYLNFQNKAPYDIELNRIQIDEENINKANIYLDIFNEDHSIKTTTIRTFEADPKYDLNTLIDQIDYTKLENLFIMDSDIRNKTSDAKAKLQAFYQNLKTKTIRYFTFKVLSVLNSEYTVGVYVNQARVATKKVPVGIWNDNTQFDNFRFGLTQFSLNKLKTYKLTHENNIAQNETDGYNHSNLEKLQLLYVDSIKEATQDSRVKNLNIDPNNYKEAGLTAQERLYKAFNSNYGQYTSFISIGQTPNNPWTTLNEENFNKLRNIALEKMLVFNDVDSKFKLAKTNEFPSVEVVKSKGKYGQTIFSMFNDSNSKNELKINLKFNMGTSEQYKTFTITENTLPFSKEESSLIEQVKNNPHSFLVPNGPETQEDFLASERSINQIFNTKTLDKYIINILDFGAKPYDDLNGTYKYSLEIRYKNSEKVLYVYNGANDNGITLDNFKKAQDPEWNQKYNDAFFTSNNADLNNKVAQINGSDFELNKTNNISYLDPNHVTNQNIKYFLKFTGASQETSDDKFKLDNQTGEKLSTEVNSENIAIVASGKISNDSESTVNINELRKQNFFVYYDVKKVNNTTIQFKIGFINKQNPNIKAHSNLITLTNLGNDLQDRFYLKQDINNIALSDLKFENLNGISIKMFKNLPDQQKLDFIKIKNNSKFVYEKYDISSNIINDFVVSDVVINDEATGSAFVNFKYIGDSRIKDQINKSSNWILVDGFQAQGTEKIGVETNLDKFYKLNNIKNTGSDVIGHAHIANNNMHKVQFNQNTITRMRKLELARKDNVWTLNKDKTQATNILLKKYYEPLLENHKNATKQNAIISVRLNALFNNKWDIPFKKINNDFIRFEIDYKLLKLNQSGLDFRGTLVGFNAANDENKKTNYLIHAQLVDQGIKFTFEVDKKDYLITQDYLNDVHTNLAKDINNLGNLDKSKAIFIDQAPSYFDILYTNSVENENFVDYETNKFKYDSVQFSQENQPILIQGQPDHIDPFEYNPNQNLDYKWTQGYHLNLEYVFESASYKAFEDIKARTFAGSFGSMTMLSKVSKDENDYRYFVVTNNHVQDDARDVYANKPLESSHKVKISRHNSNYANLYYNGESYWSGPNTAQVDMKEFWDGKQQLPKIGTDTHKVDYAIMEVDIKSALDESLKNGNFAMYQWLSNWKNLSDLKVSYDNNFFSPLQNNMTFDYSFSGFPYAKQSSYLYRRLSFSDAGYSFTGDHINPIYHNAGNSGTGVISNDGQYIAAINSGSPLWLLVAWKLNRTNIDYWGSNTDGINPLDKTNSASFVATYLRANAYNPSLYPLPKEFKNIN